jgi:hypothetical protein
MHGLGKQIPFGNDEQEQEQEQRQVQVQVQVQMQIPFGNGKIRSWNNEVMDE